MRKMLLTLGLLSIVLLSGGPAAADDEKPKKDNLRDKLKGKFGKGKIDHDKLFTRLDADKDGKLSKEEFRKVFENVGQGKLAEKLGGRLDAMADRAFARLDKDKDGYLSKKEFEAFNGGLGGIGGNLGDLKEKLKGLKDKFGKKKDD
jgi:hypothetical protein